MVVAFGEGYRALSWIHAKFDEEKERTVFAKIVYDYLKQNDITAYVGVFFWKI
ncbi:MAG: hypothetical protein ACFFCD_16600 [Promethearchaeota archaeon]